MNIQIKALQSLDEMYAAVELQKVYWGTDIESLVPAHMLFSIVGSGGHVLAALDNDRMVGVLIGLLAAEPGIRPARETLFLASKRMVVLPEYRSQGVGYRLKLAQREVAMSLGISLISWTFDPLLAANAYFNLHKLGCISRTYYENYYGTGEDNTGLTILGISDRLKVEWWVNDPEVAGRIQGQFNVESITAFLDHGVVNPVKVVDDLLYPLERINPVDTPCCLIEVPVDYPDIAKQDRVLGLAWRDQTRAAFHFALAQGYVVRDLHRVHYSGLDRAFYLLKEKGYGCQSE